jgi:tetratricopeptide (TPR) repeat protein
MAYNKTKHLNSAQKYLQQGKIPQAILEYQQILKNEPGDQVTLMTLGDLFVRQKDNAQALDYFEHLAKIFVNDGFTTKAIAIYKKVTKLAPEESRPLERLAELYVQQGVLSEARPIYLQLAEIEIKAGRPAQAVAFFRKLAEAEPDNQRIQMRLGELLISTGKQEDAVETFQSTMQRVMQGGDPAEAIRLAERILKLDPANQPAFQVKVRALTASGKSDEAAKLLESLPDHHAGGDTTLMLVDLYMESRQPSKAAELAGKVFAHDPKNYALPNRVAGALLEAGDAERAQVLIALIREPMTDSGEHELLAQTLTTLSERSPGEIEPLEWLVELFGRTSDSFRMPDALAQLANAYEIAGDDDKALATYEKLQERTPEDETVRRQCARLQAKTGQKPASRGITPPMIVAQQEQQVIPTVSASLDIEGEAPAASGPDLDEETQRYVTQALTDADLFSSYGMTQKAINLMENVLVRVPRHPTILERLFDFSVGAGDNLRAAEIATLLEQIAAERNDGAAVDRFAEFRRRFGRAAGLAPATAAPELAPPTPAPPVRVAPARVAPAPSAPPVQEFSVPFVPSQLDEPAVSPVPEAVPAKPKSVPAPVESVVHEVDLSDEWAALAQQVEEAAIEEKARPIQEVPPPESELESVLEPVLEPVLEAEPEPPAAPPQQAAPPPPPPRVEPPPRAVAPPHEPEPPAAPPRQAAPPPPPTRVAAPTPPPPRVAPPPPPPPPAPVEPVQMQAEAIEEAPAFDIELEAEEPVDLKALKALGGDSLIADLAGDLEAFTSSLGITEESASAKTQNYTPPSSAPARPSSGSSVPAAKASDPLSGPLGDLFEEFRAELGETGKDNNEDVETHYSLGVAYREMGLLEEAISEFQKVANSTDKGPAFRYAMQCSTLLGLAFMEKGQPAIAAIWYERALKTPGLDQESILALRYDLGVAQELAGDTQAAFNSFSQVYATNIDYRDVSERLALLGKAR